MRRSTRIAPRGRRVNRAVAAPAIKMYAVRDNDGATVCAAVEMVTSSKTPQPRHCRMLSRVGM